MDTDSLQEQHVNQHVVHTLYMAPQAVLQDALEKGEYWRLRDAQGKPPGVVGWWPSRAVTFLDNHDTGGVVCDHSIPALFMLRSALLANMRPCLEQPVLPSIPRDVTGCLRYEGSKPQVKSDEVR